MRTLKYILPIISILLASCSQNRTNAKIDSNDSNWQKDSLEVINSLKHVYKWHDSAKSTLMDFSVLVVDSFQTGLDFPSFEKTVKALKKSHLFSSTFITNYRELGELINKKLTTADPKYLNEINFTYQDADPWTSFQDNVDQYWNGFKISDFALSSDSASLRWWLQEQYSKTDKYLVRLIKEDGKWVVSYLDGFDKKMYTQTK